MLEGCGGEERGCVSMSDSGGETLPMSAFSHSGVRELSRFDREGEVPPAALAAGLSSSVMHVSKLAGDGVASPSSVMVGEACISHCGFFLRNILLWLATCFAVLVLMWLASATLEAGPSLCRASRKRPFSSGVHSLPDF